MTDEERSLILHTMSDVAKELKRIQEVMDMMFKELEQYNNNNKGELQCLVK